MMCVCVVRILYWLTEWGGLGGGGLLATLGFTPHRRPKTSGCRHSLLPGTKGRLVPLRPPRKKTRANKKERKKEGKQDQTLQRERVALSLRGAEKPTRVYSWTRQLPKSPSEICPVQLLLLLLAIEASNYLLNTRKISTRG